MDGYFTVVFNSFDNTSLTNGNVIAAYSFAFDVFDVNRGGFDFFNLVVFGAEEEGKFPFNGDFIAVKGLNFAVGRF